jgi:DNA topoisomerase-1
VRDPRVARVVKQCRALPGYELFQYVDEAGQRHQVGSEDVNEYVRDATGEDFTAKDFRTWGGTVQAVCALKEFGPSADEKEVEQGCVDLYKVVAEALGNTPAVCREYYVHPAVVGAYRKGTFFELWDEATEDGGGEEQEWLDAGERATLLILQRHVEENGLS